MIRLWLLGTLARRRGRIAGLAGSVALAVALVATLGAFLSSAQATMTSRSLAGVAADWQVQVAPGANATAVRNTVAHSAHSARNREVRFAHVPALTAAASGTTQTTGAAVVVTLPADYAHVFPGELRFLSGSRTGVLLAQQTASNLHASVGSTVAVVLPGDASQSFTVDGIIDFPQANSLFQVVGAPAGSQPTAPPDNVLVLPSKAFASVAGALGGHSDLVTTQFHVRRDRQLPVNPIDAYAVETSQAKNAEAALAGTARIGDNLGAALDAARGDAGYATILFLFLGLPGVVLSGMLTFTLTRATEESRRRDHALVRLRGGTTRTVSSLVVAEALTVTLLGGVAGLAFGAIVAAAALDTSAASTDSVLSWFGVAFLVGAAVVSIALLTPALRASRSVTVRAAALSVTGKKPWWSRAFFDLIALALGILVVVATTQGGYSLVLAPEGVPAVHIDYWAFLGPALIWVGAGLLVWRISDWVLSRRRFLSAAGRPIAGRVSSTVAATLARQRQVFATAITMFALALGFAGSTAMFDQTFQQQARVDARLTNGADVTAQLPAGTRQPDQSGTLRKLAGVNAVSALDHRFAYIGNDLQDLFGIDASTIDQASPLQDAWFQDTTASEALFRLRRHPDTILVSAETVKDYQLHLGDTISLRVPTERGVVKVPFHYGGIAKEFPTAPKDSFFVANASYLSKATGSTSTSGYLIATGSPNQLAHQLRGALGADAAVTTLASTQAAVGSSLTAVDLGGLTLIQSTFALLLAVGAGALVFALGFGERRRSYAIIRTQGASIRQLRAMSLTEAVVIGITGTLTGLAIALGIGGVLTAVLDGVFDPPPEFVVIPVAQLAGVVAGTLAALAISALLVTRSSGVPAVERMRAD